MSYDPLLARAKGARDQLQAEIRKANAAKLKAQTELDMLFNLEAMLNLDAIVDAVEEGRIPPTNTEKGDSNG